MVTLSLKAFWPKTLWGQTLASTAVILIVGQLSIIALFSNLILRPELDRVARVMAEGVASVSSTLQEATPEQRARMMQHLTRTRYLQVWNGAEPPDDSGPPPRAIERVFMRDLADALGDETDISWRTDRTGRLWVHLYLGPDPYWISVQSPRILRPSGMIMVSALVSLLLALTVAWLLSTRLMRPLNNLKSATHGFQLGQPALPLREDGPREIADLSRSFNAMTERLAGHEAERTLILAGISHDVRTPLAKLHLALEMMRNEDPDLQASAQRQIDSIDRILSQFMLFARGFDAEPVGSIDAAGLVFEAVADYGPHGVAPMTGSLDIHFAGRPEAVRRALMNLVENAVRYGSAPILIGIFGREDGIDVVVRDHGPGIARDKIDGVTRPFVRADVARQPAATDTLPVSGTGLGLAIAEKVAQLHGGVLRLRNLADGFEARLTIKS